MRRKVGLAGASMLALGGLLSATAESAAQSPAGVTRIAIRVISQDAKIIGDGVGGALIRVVDAETGRTLAEGKQEGNTGDTQLIMSTPRARGMKIFDTEGAAAFIAELEIDRPTVVTISATGPLSYPQATKSASKQMLVVPGQNVMGDGVLLTLHGFIVEIVEPEPLQPVGRTIDVRARVQMMCGCPIEPLGLWDSQKKSFVARLLADGRVVSERPMQYARNTSLFSALLPVPDGIAGRDLELEVLASEAGTANFGRHAIPLGGS